MFTKEQLLNCIPKTQKSGFVPVENLKEKVIQNALNNFAKSCRREDVVAIYDFTIMGNGKKGYLLATDGIYGYDFNDFKRHTSNVTKVPFEGLKKYYTFKNSPIEKEKSVGIGDSLHKFIYEDGSSIVIYLSAVNIKNVFPVIDRVLNLIHEQDERETSDLTIKEKVDATKESLAIEEEQESIRLNAFSSAQDEIRRRQEELKELKVQMDALLRQQEALNKQEKELKRVEERRKEEIRLAEEKRQAEEAKLAEEKRLAEEARIAEEKRLAEEARIEEEKRLAEEVRIAEENVETRNCVSASDFRVGLLFEINGEPCMILEYKLIVPRKNTRVVFTKYKNLITGMVKKESFGARDTFFQPDIETLEVQYLYNEGNLYYFMNNETYDQIIVTSEIAKNAVCFIREFDNAEIMLFQGKPIMVKAPEIVTLRVIKTEPAVENQSSGNVNKLATVETGAVVEVPSFIEEDDIISIMTHCGNSYGDYIGRKEADEAEYV